MLEIDIEDVYFLMGLSRRGAPIILSRHWATPLQTNAYIAQFCVSGSQKEGGRIVIKDVRDLPLRSILFTITKMVGSTSPHISSKSQMAYVVQCLEPRIFNWCARFLRNVKEKISKCRMGRKKQFGYKYFLVSFFLERVPQMQPQVALIVHPASEPWMERWTSLSPRTGE
jgi:hypothetical protein